MDFSQVFSDIFSGIWTGIVWTVLKAGLILFFLLILQGIVMIYLKWVTKIEVDENGYMLLDPNSWHFRLVYRWEMGEIKDRFDYYNSDVNYLGQKIDNGGRTLTDYINTWTSGLKVKMCPYAAKIWSYSLGHTIYYSMAAPLRWLLCITISTISIPLFLTRLVNGIWVPGKKFRNAVKEAGNGYYSNFSGFNLLFHNIGKREKIKFYWRPIVPLTPIFVLYVYISNLVKGTPWVMYATVILIPLATVVGSIILTTIIIKKYKKSTDLENRESIEETTKQRMLEVELNSQLGSKLCPIAKVKPLRD